MLPLRDINPTRRFPIATTILIAINVVVFLWEQSLTMDRLQEVFLTLSVVPNNISENPFSSESILDMVRSMFFHGGWAHLGGNMLYLYLFGDNVEDRLGIPLYLGFYFLSGFGAAAAQVAIDPNSTIPLVGASGAIAGVLGGYLVLFPGVKVQGIVPIGGFAALTEWPAWTVLILWFALQLLNGIATIGPETGAEGGGVAFFAHIGGFVAGAIFVWLFTLMMPQPPPKERRQALYQRAKDYRF